LVYLRSAEKESENVNFKTCKELHLKNKWGLWTTTSLVIGNMVGAGVFLLPSALATYGGISLIGWVLSAVGALFIAKVFSATSKMLPGLDGGPYSYTRQGLGDFAGFLVGWGYWISVWCSNAAIAVSLVSALSTFFHPLSTNPALAILTGLGAIWLLTWVNMLGIKASGEVQLITTILKLVPLAVIAVIGFFYIRWENFIPFNTSGVSALKAIGGSASLTLFAFLGIECATIPAGNIAEPEKTIPKATMLGTGITILLYILAMTSVMGIIEPRILQHSVTPFADAAALLWGNSARYWVGAGVAIAAFGALNGWILIQGQIPMAIARDRLFPSVFSRQNKRGAPALGILISSVLVSVFMAMNFTKGLVEQFTFMLLLATLTSLVPYLFVAASYVILVIEKKQTMTRGAWSRVLVPASLAFFFSVLAVIGLGETVVFWGFVLLLCGVPFYVWNHWKRSPGHMEGDRKDWFKEGSEGRV
jgi:APA family basic amino acid/polyamine antiporter